MANVGYVRVSSIAQNTERQLDKVDLDEKFEEKISAKDTKRPKLQECLKYVRKGDTLHVHSIDRLARNLEDLQQIVKKCTDKGVVVKFHKNNLTFTGEDNPMQELMLQVLGAVAQFERALIRERQQEGIERAKASGKHCGRPLSLSKEQQAEIRDKREAGATPTELAREYGVSRGLIYRLCPADETRRKGDALTAID